MEDRTIRMCRAVAAAVVLALLALEGPGARPANAQQTVQLTLDSAVDLAMGVSYRIKQLELGIERTRFYLQSRQASLKSRVDMRLSSPELQNISESKWNSLERKEEIYHENTSRWQMDLAIRQPVLLFGYPTNGYLSINNRIYRYLQKDLEPTDGLFNEIDYYNRYYLKFEQPFFLPNNLKNNIEDAELDLKSSELEYLRDRVQLMDEVADDYYDLYDVVYRDRILHHQLDNLNQVYALAERAVQRDSGRAIERVQVQVELTNARENMLKNQMNIRREQAQLKQRLRLSLEDSVFIDTAVRINPIQVDVEQAIEYGFTLAPQLKMLSINKRKNELDLSNSKGWDGFHLNLEMTYGLEKQQEDYRQVWNDFTDSYSVSVNAYVPIWDWGQRKARIQATEIGVRRTELYIEENRNNIRSNIVNAVDNLQEYQQRVLNMQSNLDMVQEISDFGMRQYGEGAISLQDLLQMIVRQKETEQNFLEAYLGYRRALLELMRQTYYDYENDITLMEKFRAGSS